MVSAPPRQAGKAKGEGTVSALSVACWRYGTFWSGSEGTFSALSGQGPPSSLPGPARNAALAPTSPLAEVSGRRWPECCPRPFPR